MGYRLLAVSGKFGGNRRLPTGKVNPGREATAAAGVSIEGEAHAVCRVPVTSHHRRVGEPRSLAARSRQVHLTGR